MWMIGAASLPIIAAAIAFALDVDPSRWHALSPPLVRQVLADALLIEILLLMIAAPLAGVILRDRPADLVIIPLVIAATSGFGLLSLIGWHAMPVVFVIVGAAHATLFAAALLFMGLGAAAGSWWRDPLDAAALSICAALLITIGPFLAGPLAGLASRPAVNTILTINPLVATAAAADIDVLRMDLLYRMSPIAHRQFAYPSWPVSAGIFALAAASLMLLSVRHTASATRLAAAR
jgi:hypothetical protein